MSIPALPLFSPGIFQLMEDRKKGESMMNTGKKTLLALSVLALLSGVTGADAADLKITNDQDLSKLAEEWKPDANNIYHSIDKNNNTISVSGGTIKQISIYGGNATVDGTGSVEGNTVEITGGTFESGFRNVFIVGGSITGKNEEISAKNNHISISEMGGSIHNVYGASVNISQEYSGKGLAENNSVTITNGNIANVVYGAMVNRGTVRENKVEIHDSQIGSVAGGVINGKKDGNSISNNSVVISGDTTIKWGVKGGHNLGSGTAVVNNNSVTITGGTVESGGVSGGYTGKGSANGNRVELSGNVQINGTSEADAVYGGRAWDETSGNTVNIHIPDGTNKINLIYGGYSSSANSKSEGNKVTISGTTIGKAVGGYSGGDAKGNIVELTNVTAEGDIAGGLSKSTSKDNVATVEGNTVTINGGTYTGSIYGGLAESTADRAVTVSGNTVYLKGEANLTSASVYGGAAYYTSNGNQLVNEMATIENNTLQVSGNTTVKDVKNFSRVEFADVEFGQTGLTVTGDTDLTKDTSYEVVSLAADQNVAADSVATLLTVQNSTFEGFEDQEQTKITQGTAFDLTGYIHAYDDKTLQLIFKSKELSVQTTDITRSHMTAVGFLLEGSDLVLTGIHSLAQDHIYGLQTFAATERSDSSYDGGTDINGWRVIAGVGAQHKTGAGDLAWGVFAERGLGSYTTEINHGSGDVEYNGGGVALRLTKENGTYAEASYRMGKLHDDVENGLIADGIGYDYDTRADYKSFHAGVGKLFKGTSGTLDVYGKYFYTKADGVGFLAANQYELSSIKSQRVRLGARYSQKANSHLGFYYGAAWEYEFDGDADGRVAGYALDTASLGGSTFIGEVGLTYKPQDDSRWDFELGVKGYGGERDGVSGILRGAYHF